MTDENEEGQKESPMKVIKDRMTQGGHARVVPNNGKVPHAVRAVGQVIGDVVRTDVIHESGQEPVVLDLQELTKVREGVGQCA